MKTDSHGSMKQSQSKSGLRNAASSASSDSDVSCRGSRLAMLGLLSIVIDASVTEILLVAGFSAEMAQVVGFIAAAVFIAVAARIFFSQSGQTIYRRGWVRAASWLIVSVLALLLRSSVQLLLLDKWHSWPYAALFVTAAAGDVIFLAGLFFSVLSPPKTAELDWRLLTIGSVIYILLIKLVFMVYLNLIPEEAYYWNYARHLDFGYLDHPPMVAWLIWLSTSLLGKSELSVRLPALLCWLMASTFMVRLTSNLFGRAAAYRAVLLLTLLPIYFGMGFFMTPDAPLFATWTACLYFAERALLAQERRAWWWLGVCLGLGLLAKYPIALLGTAIVVFLLSDRRSRGWFLRPEPYLAAVTAFLLFSPVVLWNMRNGWMSFAFQGTGRWSGSHHFGLHVLFGSVLLLLTPTGLLGVLRAFGRETAARSVKEIERRQYLWAAIFTFVPLSVFFVYSLVNIPKLNWTAPVWLAAIPLVAIDMEPVAATASGVWSKFTRSLWPSTIVALLLLLPASFYYIALGLPGAGLMSPERLFGEWQELGNKARWIAGAVEAQTGSAPILVGMDRNFIASELSFYGASDGEQVYPTTSSHLFGQRSLMWSLWFPASAAVGRDLIMIDFDAKRLSDSALAHHFVSLGETSAGTLENHGRLVGRFYWRVGRSYRQ